MISIAKITEEIVRQTPYIEEALMKGIINLSGLARSIQSQIEKKVKKKIKIGAIIVALKRLKNNISAKTQKTIFIQPLNMTVRSDLMEFTFTNSETLIECQKQLLQEIEREREIFCNITHGMSETTIIASVILKDKIKMVFRKEKLIAKIERLSSVTIKYPDEIIYTPAVYYTVLKLLAWEGINLIEAASTYTELTLVFKGEDVNRAFAALTDYFKRE